MNLNDVKVGDSATILSIKDSKLEVTLLRLGVKSGKKIFLKRKAPLGGSVEFWVGENSYALRTDQASLIEISKEVSKDE